MLHRFLKTARPRNSGSALAGFTAALGLVGCIAVLWIDSMAYADLSTARLQSRVGNKGACCTPGLLTSCESVPPVGCSSSGVVCNVGTSSFDQCANPTCGDSDNNNDQCDSSEYASYSISATTCTITSSATVACGSGGQQCIYLTASATVDFTGCGGATICSSTSGLSCQ